MLKKSLLLLIMMSLTSVLLYSQTYQVKKYVFGSSASTASNSSYTFQNTVGQPAIGEYSSTDNNASVGFWYGNTAPGEDETIEIEFQEGWNLVSSYISHEYMDMETYINNISLVTVIVKDGNSDIYIPSAGLNTIGDWNIPDGYNVYVSEACTLSVTGTPATPENETIPLNTGWNMIGYTRNSDMNPADAYSSISSDVVIVKNGDGRIYIPKYNLNTIGDLTPGDGYMLFYKTTGDFTYPANSMSKSYYDNYFDNITKYYTPDVQNTGKSAVYLIHTDLPDYSEIAIYNDDVILGTGVVRHNVAAITVWGDNEMTENTDGAEEFEALNCKYYYKGTEKEIQVNNIISHTDDINEFNYNTNSFKTADAYLNISDKPEIYVSPNPVKDLAVINFHVQYDSNVEVKLVNNIGKTIKVLANKYYSPATYTLNLRTDGIAQGTYFIVMTTDDNVITQPVVIVK
jgi:hypothetical protein